MCFQQVRICIGVLLSTIHLCGIYDAHMPTSLWDFYTHRSITYIFFRNVILHAIFCVDFYTRVCFSLFISLTNGIFTSVPISVLFYMKDYMRICDQCHDGIFALMWFPHSPICISSSWLCERKSFITPLLIQSDSFDFWSIWSLIL